MVACARECVAAEPGVGKVPLVGPGKYGVWCATLGAESGVAQLCEYLQTYWKPHLGELRLRHPEKVLQGYQDYPVTTLKYDPVAQRENTLRWRKSVNTEKGMRQYLPGFDLIEQSVMKDLLPSLFPSFAHGLSMYNGHILRQGHALDGGSSFDTHIDEADDAPNSVMLYVSVAIKLTDDPDEADGTWMQVEGFQPVRYGRKAGSVVVFLSRRPHRSLRTPRNMGTLLKLVLFYNFVDCELRAAYERVASPHLGPLHGDLNVLPQVNDDFSPPEDTVPGPSSLVTVAEADETALHSTQSQDADISIEDTPTAWSKMMKEACKAAWSTCKDMLSQCWEPKEGQVVQLRLDKHKEHGAGPFDRVFYGICGQVRAKSTLNHPQ